MGRPCTICNHLAKDRIEELIREGNFSFQYISKFFNLNVQAMDRHAKNHMQLPTKPRKGELVVEFEHRPKSEDHSKNWTEFALTTPDLGSCGMLYLNRNLQPVLKTIRLKKIHQVVQDFKL